MEILSVFWQKEGLGPLQTKLVPSEHGEDNYNLIIQCYEDLTKVHDFIKLLV